MYPPPHVDLNEKAKGQWIDRREAGINNMILEGPAFARGKASGELTKGYRWSLFCLGLASVPVVLLGLICFCVGAAVAEAVVFTAFALAYRFLQERPRAVANA